MPLKQKTAKAQQETPEAQLQHSDCASSTRNKKKLHREPNKIITCHLHRSNKKLWKPNRKPRKPKQTQQKADHARRETKQSPRELNKAFPFAPLKQKTAKAQQQNAPKAQLRHKNVTAIARPCHHRAHMSYESPTGCLESPTHSNKTKNCASPTRN